MKTRMLPPLPLQIPAKRGGALVSVIILSAIILLLVGSYLSALVGQNRISQRAVLHNEARNAADGVAALALGEVDRIAQTTSYFGAGTNPNMLSEFSLDPYRGLLAPSGTDVNRRILSDSLEFKSSGLSSKRLDAYGNESAVTLDYWDPVNIGTTERGQKRRVRTMEVFAKATARDPAAGREVTSYVAQEVRIASGSYFDFNVFGNMDIEFHAGAKLSLESTYSNFDAYITGWSSNAWDYSRSITFTTTLSTHGYIYRFIKYKGVASGNPAPQAPYKWGGTNAERNGQVAPVICTKSGGGTENMVNHSYISEIAGTNDSTVTNFAGSNPWGGNVQDASYAVPSYNLPGMKDFVPEQWVSNIPQGRLRNNAYFMIEPQLSNASGEGRKTPTGQPTSDALEDQKFSALAGFVIEVVAPTAAGRPPKWKLKWYKAMDDTNPLSSQNLPQRVAHLPVVAGTIDPFSDAVDEVDLGAAEPTDTTLTKVQRELRIALLRAIVTIPYNDDGGGNYGTGGAFTKVLDYTPKVGKTSAEEIRVQSTNTAAQMHNFQSKLNLGRGDSMAAVPAPVPAVPGIFASANVNTSPAQNPKYYPVFDRREAFVNGQATNGTVNQGLKGAFHTLIIDMVKLNEVLNDPVLWQKPGTAAIFGYDPIKRFNGIVYVQFPLVPASDSTVKARIPTSETGTGPADADKVRPAVGASTTTPGYAVLVRNAGGSGTASEATGFLPQVAGSTASVLKGGAVGFTLATNGPVYIWGNYNSDGRNSVTAATSVDTLDTPDPTRPAIPTSWSTGRTRTIHTNQAGATTTVPDVGRELSSLIAADAVTVLAATPRTSTHDGTNDFPLMTQKILDYSSGGDPSQLSGVSGHRYKAYNIGSGDSGVSSTFTEISTAIVAGITPTRPGYQDVWSGGVHNFVRFLQNWQSDSSAKLYAYRGSLVLLFESEVAKGYYYDNGKFQYWFNGPNLAWGYHEFFRAGNYPPGTPLANTVRCLSLRDISKTAYDAGPTTPDIYYTGP